MLCATTACTFSTSHLAKVVRAWCALYILTCKSALRHNGVHFFDISTCKHGLSMVCFVHFDLEMCSAPQRRATLHLSFEYMVRTRRFSEPTFRSSEPQIIGNRCSKSRLSYLCTQMHLLSSHSLSLFLFSDLLTPFLLLSDSSHLCFSICP